MVLLETEKLLIKMALSMKERLQQKIQQKQTARTKHVNMLPKENFSIYDTILRLQEDRLKLSAPALNRKYIEIRQQYPDLYEMCKNNKLTETQLDGVKKMLEVREELREGNLSREQADELAKEHLFRAYHPGVIEKLQEKKDGTNIETIPEEEEEESDSESDIEVVEI